EKRRRVSLDEASDFIALRKQILPVVGIGVILCITCPIVLILLSGLASEGILGLSENVAVAIGLLVLFGQIGAALYLFITRSGKLKNYEFLEQEAFETEYGVDGMAKERLAMGEAANTKALTTGVLMCIFSPVPLIITSVMGASSFVIVTMVCLLLLVVAVAVYLFISVCGVYSSYKILLQTGDYSSTAKKKNKKIDGLSRAYWMLITFIYLVISFVTGRWDMTWIIWAVSGVLFALIRIVADNTIKAE
ncbi:MAG: XRE family transcriptional regulator, partial [Lachnospiraceae bacterium]|nr:XRE family transcriptional regulator [Lachnospiraceae bacterium]